MASTAPQMTQAEFDEEVGALSGGQVEHLRLLGRNNLFVLAKGILRYKDVSPRTHGAFCKFFQSHSSLRRLGLMPRGHLKSSLATIADSVRLALADPEYARMLIVGETATTAEKFLEETKGHFEKETSLIRKLFPELIPERFAGPGVKWSSNLATIRRQSRHKEATWEAIGVGGAITGSHFTRIKCDDLIGFEAARSPAKMAEVKAWVDNIEALLTDQHTDIIDWIGTRWSRVDLYWHLMQDYGADLAVFTREAIEDGEIIFPQKYTWEAYRRIQRRPAVWFAQYCNNPLADGQTDFDSSLVRPFRFSDDGLAVQFLDDAGREKRWLLSQLDVVLCADPNSGSLTAPDTAAISVVGVSPEDEVFVLFSWSGRVSPSKFVDRIYETAKRYRPRVVGIEKAGQQNTQHYFELKAEREAVSFRVVPVLPMNRQKEERIRASVEPVLNSGRLYIQVGSTVLRQQIADFPQSLLIDELDALAYFSQVSRKPYVEKDLGDARKVLKLVMRHRNRITGY